MLDTVLDPIALFSTWYDEAKSHEEIDPDVMALATATRDARPSVRMVLYKGLDTGWIFYTNYQSHKGEQLTENPQAALAFYWPKAYRQVRIEGRIERLSPEASAAYFHSRPRGSQIAACVSPQSQVIPSRESLLNEYERFAASHLDQEIACPPHWGGYRLVPDMIEFWQGQTHRLHDRYCYYRDDERGWRRVHLAP